MAVWSVISSQRQASPVLLQETYYLNKGSNGALFYAHVKPVDDMMGEVYIAPSPNAGSVLAGATLLQRARTVPSVSHAKHFISIAEQSFCSSQQARWQLLYLVAKDLHQKPDIQALKTDIICFNDWDFNKYYLAAWWFLCGDRARCKQFWFTIRCIRNGTLHKLPAETKVPYGNWIAYLTEMAK